MKKGLLALCLMLCLLHRNTQGQSKLVKLADSLMNLELTFVPTPVVFRTPETSWAAGVSIGYYFKSAKEHTRSSNLQLQLVRTFNNQTLARISGDIFTPRERWFIHYYTGYKDYFDRFYGIGPGVTEGMREDFRFQTVISAVKILNKASDNLFVGINGRFQTMFDLETKPGSQLDTGRIVGRDGSRTSGFGPELLYDTRDNILSPLRGIRIEALHRWHPTLVGNPYFHAASFDFRHYTNIQREHVWANRLHTKHHWGEPPFREIGMAGGSSLVRGYFEGRYRDLHLMAVESELRLKIWKIFGGNLFSSVFQVGPDPAALFAQQWRGSYGAGLRVFLNKKERIVIRFDVARTFEGHTAFYIDLNEAF